MSFNIHDVGFLPGRIAAKYVSSRIVVMKNWENHPLIVEWLKRTGKTRAELSRLNYAFLANRNPNGQHQVDFVKCRDRSIILAWCREQWGEPAADGRWYLIPGDSYNPRMFISDEEDVIMFKMVWE